MNAKTPPAPTKTIKIPQALHDELRVHVAMLKQPLGEWVAGCIRVSMNLQATTKQYADFEEKNRRFWENPSAHLPKIKSPKSQAKGKAK